MGKILAILPFFGSQSAEFGKRTPEKFPTKFPCTLGNWRESRGDATMVGTERENF